MRRAAEGAASGTGPGPRASDLLDGPIHGRSHHVVAVRGCGTLGGLGGGSRSSGTLSGRGPSFSPLSSLLAAVQGAPRPGPGSVEPDARA